MPRSASVAFRGARTVFGKSHLAVATGLAACHQHHPVLFASAIDAINSLASAQAAVTGFRFWHRLFLEGPPAREPPRWPDLA